MTDIAHRAGCGRSLVHNWKERGILPPAEGTKVMNGRILDGWTEPTMRAAIKVWREGRHDKAVANVVGRTTANRFEALWEAELRRPREMDLDDQA